MSTDILSSKIYFLAIGKQKFPEYLDVCYRKDFKNQVSQSSAVPRAVQCMTSKTLFQSVLKYECKQRLSPCVLIDPGHFLQQMPSRVLVIVRVTLIRQNQMVSHFHFTQKLILVEDCSKAIPPILLRWPAMSEMDVGVMIVEVESFH